jgi:hypothetical protein
LVLFGPKRKEKAAMSPLRLVARRLLLITPLLLLLVAGCGGNKTYPVQGRVVFKDGTPIEPLVGGQVVFEPLDPGAKESARGIIQPDGTFRLGTHDTADGAPLGRYRVLVSPQPLPPKDAEKRPPAPVVDLRYQSPDKSPLEQTVTTGPNDFTITVERP